jgi:hypothetical protein
LRLGGFIMMSCEALEPQRFPNPWLCGAFTQSLMRFLGLLQSFAFGLPDYSGTTSLFLQPCGICTLA